MNDTSKWTKDARALIEWGCAKVGMDQVADAIEVQFNDRMRTTMGRAWTNYGPETRIYKPEYVQAINSMDRPGGLIVFCTAIWARVDDSARRANVLHELAHILANLKLGRSAKHGRYWKAMMRQLGEEPKRCHSHDVSGLRRQQRRFSMSCPGGCGWSFTFSAARRTRRINAARRGAMRGCPQCRAVIRLEHWIATQEI